MKNLFELKNAQHVVLDGNLIENVWAAGQYGYALVLTPRNQNGGASWVRVRDVTITNNIIRNVAGVLQLMGYDSVNTSQQSQRITLRNNLFQGIDPKWGSSAKAYLVGEGVASLTIDRNTLIHANTSVVYAYGKLTMSGFVYTNNISVHGKYGIMAEGGRPGQYSIDKYFPGAIVQNNVLAGGSASAYPKPNAFPSIAQWTASFVDLAGGDYRLRSTSVFYAAGAGGSVPGANIGVLNDAQAGQVTTLPSTPEPTPTTPPPAPSNTAPVARPGGPYSGKTGALIAVDGGASTDAEGPISGYRWAWGDEILDQRRRCRAGVDCRHPLGPRTGRGRRRRFRDSQREQERGEEDDGACRTGQLCRCPVLRRRGCAVQALVPPEGPGGQLQRTTRCSFSSRTQ